MPSQHRRRSHKDAVDERHTPRLEESHADPYSRPLNDFRQTTNRDYRRNDTTSSHSGRGSYETSRGSSSRSQRDSNWRPKDAERSYADDYYRERRDDMGASRQPESWPARTVPEPRYSEREWSQSQRYDTGYSTSSYPEESSSWDMPPSNSSLGHRNGHKERWNSPDTRGNAFKSRPPPERTQNVDPRQEWHNRGNTTEFVDPWNTLLHAEHNKPVVDNRSWEPAPTWQPSGSGERQHNRNQNGPRSGYYSKPSAGGRGTASSSSNNASHRNHSNYTNTKQQREWKDDDVNPNKCVVSKSLSRVASLIALAGLGARDRKGLHYLHRRHANITVRRRVPAHGRGRLQNHIILIVLLVHARDPLPLLPHPSVDGAALVPSSPPVALRMTQGMQCGCLGRTNHCPSPQKAPTIKTTHPATRGISLGNP
ncbi:hypothetical protein C8R45DRAFT_220986 [Mycena sanguinolenta]|nr:hypothetical protein C8R45DRAFT_220986 [Mycena sanguinolenta]